ncbi:GNAT family N-acetyltransferase [Methanolobus sp. WCC5]|uniref:GNAT family N-acetyltransferase n=1 Tax=Methanolobus sp. WCC5 TaxID=3125785 RepID=UPI003249EA2C
MEIVPFSPEYSSRTRSFVLGVLSEEGFDYDSLKDSDLDDIHSSYFHNGGVFFLSLHREKLIGTSAVKNLGCGVCEIKRLYVKKECRGKGIGLSLFLTALEFAKKDHLCIKLKTDSSLKKAISMYLKSGFVVVKKNNGTMWFERHL